MRYYCPKHPDNGTFNKPGNCGCCLLEDVQMVPLVPVPKAVCAGCKGQRFHPTSRKPCQVCNGTGEAPADIGQAIHDGDDPTAGTSDLDNTERYQ